MNPARNDAAPEGDPRAAWPAFGGLTPAATPLGAATAAAMAGAGLRPPRRVLLLEAGIGVGLAAIAAAGAGSELEVWGAESDPELVAEARALLDAAGLDARVIEAGPGGLAAMDLPEFDLALAPWGWDLLDETARAAALAFLGARVAPGGGFLCAFSVQPGARPETALRQLVANRWAAAPAGLSGAARRDWTVEALRRGFGASYRLVRETPRWAATLAAMSACTPAMFERAWIAPAAELRGMRDFGRELRAAGFETLVPGRPERLARDLDMSAAQAAEVDACPDPWSAAELADLMMWRVSRLDLFIRPGGPAPDPGAVRLRGLGAPGLAETGELRTEGLLGAAALSRAVYGPMLARLERQETASLTELAADAGRPLEATIPLAGALIGAGLAAPAAFAAPAAVPVAAHAASARLTEVLAARGHGRWSVSALLGGAVATPVPTAAAAARALGLTSG
ncbi:class I SAM-dependent methyltransferase [Albimonas pacifica]|uniref:Methyltransferase domain-containing protein n=1 Tax=Albimonas pacifica TaxID=1114924 RepID=A0A1I3NNS7_9RHOB|nr:class I SAM-dependent methyltransferase [Albimonas pacifica]SFJ10819.1 hypothetical protein SAMN05216258_1148 [Albimonas pacifica]